MHSIPFTTHWTLHYPLQPSAHNPVRRLRTGFAFVGLTDEFDVSVCLFHAMRGHHCLPIERQNNRATNYSMYPCHHGWMVPRTHNKTSESIKALSSPSSHSKQRWACATPEQQTQRLRAEYTDPYDTPLYRAAVERFQADLARYQVTQRRCEDLNCATPQTQAFFALAGGRGRDKP